MQPPRRCGLARPDLRTLLPLDQRAQIYTVWNYRREALGPAFEAGGEAAQKASDEELTLTQVGAGGGGEGARGASRRRAADAARGASDE
jgi:hypothetical protein